MTEHPAEPKGIEVPRDSAGRDQAERARRLLAAGRRAEAIPLLLEAAEDALRGGVPEVARSYLVDVSDEQLDGPLTKRLAMLVVQIGRYLNRHRDALAWLESRLALPHEPGTHAVLLAARITALRSVDARAALELVDEALAAADAAGNEDAAASLFANACFAAYRRGDPRTAYRYAAQASGRTYASPRARLSALRAEMFAAIADDLLERALSLSLEIGDHALALGDLALAANEHNNVAEILLKLGRPTEALAAATRAGALADQAGHRTVARFARALVANARAEDGELHAGIDGLRDVNLGGNAPFDADAAAALSYYLVERGRPDDVVAARDVARTAATSAEAAGVTHVLTRLLATEARACHRLGEETFARDALARARRAAEEADMASELHLALTMAELYAPGDPPREVALSAARTRLLRLAGKRRDPRAYCTQVRLHRRLLELSGGVPADLPPSADGAVA